MARLPGLFTLFSAGLLSLFLATSPFAAAADRESAPKSGRIAGIVIEKKDGWLSVKADGEDEPVKYVIGDNPDRRLLEVLKWIFNASRVQLIYRTEGDTRRLVAISKQILRTRGTVTGEVVKVHDNFWVEVKPKNGPADAYAPGANFQDKEFMARLRGLKKGDSVTIQFYTDFERHRILSLRINEQAQK